MVNLTSPSGSRRTSYSQASEYTTSRPPTGRNPGRNALGARETTDVESQGHRATADVADSEEGDTVSESSADTGMFVTKEMKFPARLMRSVSTRLREAQEAPVRGRGAFCVFLFCRRMALHDVSLVCELNRMRHQHHQNASENLERSSLMRWQASMRYVEHRKVVEATTFFADEHECHRRNSWLHRRTLECRCCLCSWSFPLLMSARLPQILNGGGASTEDNVRFVRCGWQQAHLIG